MNRSPAHRALEWLERRERAQLACTAARMASLNERRNEVLRNAVAAIQALHSQTAWDAFVCLVHAGFTARNAVQSAKLVGGQRTLLESGKRIALRRQHWARCLRGLERRELRRGQSPLAEREYA